MPYFSANLGQLIWPTLGSSALLKSHEDELIDCSRIISSGWSSEIDPPEPEMGKKLVGYENKLGADLHLEFPNERRPHESTSQPHWQVLQLCAQYLMAREVRPGSQPLKPGGPVGERTRLIVGGKFARECRFCAWREAREKERGPLTL